MYAEPPTRVLYGWCRRRQHYQLDVASVLSGGLEGANIISWLHSTETCLHICPVPEPMWVATASGRLAGPAGVFFTNWASQDHKVT
ncbi:hypothetical protein DSO57_1033646 [Entomophthora muscae]|uniref:Uncharacterized protein n=1 Tax=Entomophthora muscae TaxID=34485 RepID=A0ACC2RES3_9FUNG|nr:hypothetical protein DSO57_1033646 [Entomophthora muscae]